MYKFSCNRGHWVVLLKHIRVKFQRNNVYTFTRIKFLVDKITFMMSLKNAFIYLMPPKTYKLFIKYILCVKALFSAVGIQ